MLPWPVRPAWRSSVFDLGGRYVSDGLQKAAVVEPVDPFQRGELHGFEVAPRPTSMDDLSLVKAVHRFGESGGADIAQTGMGFSTRA